MQGVRKDMLRDVECYGCGEDPSPLVLLRASRLEDWSARIARRGSEYVLMIYGDVYKHPAHSDGTGIKTSAVVWFDRRRRFVRTHNRLYVLGKPASESS
jgi:hypothetical protein